MNLELQLIMIPVSDVDRAKDFYTERVGFVCDHDQRVHETLRFVQLTPPGSACSIAFGEGLFGAGDEPGPYQGLQLVADDIEEVHAALAGRGLDVSDVDDQAWGRFVYFQDPDGNAWNVQQLVPMPGG